jgi:hypothetical protein
MNPTFQALSKYLSPLPTRVSLLSALLAALVCHSGVAATLFVDGVSAVNGASPGMNISAHYDLGTDFTCCDPANLRWLQDVHVTDNSGHALALPGFAANFIDPQPGQNIGNDYDGNPQTGDTLPWYDVTRNQAARTGAFALGAGAYFEDGPGGAAFNNNAPIRVDFNTLVVCTTPSPGPDGGGTFYTLGGFSWGFIIDPKNSNPQLLSVTAITGDALINEFNDLIDANAAFGSWRMVTAGDCDFTVVVPETSTLYAGTLLLLPFCVQGVRRYRHRCWQAA